MAASQAMDARCKMAFTDGMVDIVKLLSVVVVVVVVVVNDASDEERTSLWNLWK